MRYISKHYQSEGCGELTLKKSDWSPEVWKAFLDMFELTEAYVIVVTEYKLGAWGEEKGE